MTSVHLAKFHENSLNKVGLK